MKKEVSVVRAIVKGQLMVNLPVCILFFTPFILFAYLMKHEIVPNAYGFIGFGLSFVLSFVVSWFYWSFMITRWRIWAFSVVKDVHELRRMAVTMQLIWAEGHVFEQTERRTTVEQAALIQLETKLDVPEVTKS